MLSSHLFHHLCHRRRKIHCVLALWWLLTAWGFPTGNATAEVFNEYQVKAVFIYNLTHFITWPPGAFANDNAPFIVGILGSDPFGGLLDKVLLKETVNHRPILLMHYSDHEELKKSPCHLLFINQTSPHACPRLLQTAYACHILTVSDTRGFLEAGGMVNLVTERGRIRIEINLPAARQAGIKISAQLLNLSKIHTGNSSLGVK